MLCALQRLLTIRYTVASMAAAIGPVDATAIAISIPTDAHARHISAQLALVEVRHARERDLALLLV